jgi:hypothetical protein
LTRLQNADLKARVAVAALVLLAITLACRAQPTASTDRLPSEDWTYDALRHFAARGLVPGMSAQRFDGDWLYTREEMAAFVRQVAVSPDVAEGDRPILAKLAAEFLPELTLAGADSVLAEIERSGTARTLLGTGAFEPRVAISRGDTDLIGIYDVTALGVLGRDVMAVGTLSDRRREFDGDAFSRLEKLFISGKTPSWEWGLGKDWLWWGPGYSGSMILSDNSPAFPMLKMGKDFYFGRHIGRVKVTQFLGRFEDDGQTFYLAGRRWEKRFSTRLHVGISETAKTSKRPNPLILILPSIYLYQHIYIEDVDKEFNVLVGMDATYRFSPRFESYFDLVVDDMKAPKFLREGPAWNIPRKLGLLVGGNWPDVLGDGTTGLRAEYIFTDPGTYGATRPDFPQLAYTHDGFVIGHPVGPNSEAIFLRLDRKLGPAWTAAADYLGRKPHKLDGPNPESTHRISLLLAHELYSCSRLSLTLRYDSLKLPAKENRVQVGVSYAF